MLLDHSCTRLKIIDFGLSRKFIDGMEVKEMLGTPEFVGESALRTKHDTMVMPHDEPDRSFVPTTTPAVIIANLSGFDP